MEKLGRGYFFLWFIPLAWFALAGLGWIYRGGEFITFGVALMPGILVSKLIGVNSLSDNDFVWITAAGLLPMLLAGGLLDFARVRLKVFVISFCVGIVIAYILIAIPFSSEARRLGSISAAAHKFDFDQPDRAIAWQVLCTVLGLYISVPIALVWRGAAAARQKRDGARNRTLQA